MENKSKEYSKKFYENHKNDNKTICNICYGSYSIFNKSHHFKTQKHKRAEEFKKNELLLLETFSDEN